MIELKITAADVNDFYKQSGEALAFLMAGGPQWARARAAEDAAQKTAELVPAGGEVSDVTQGPSTPDKPIEPTEVIPPAEKPKRTRVTKPATTIEAEPAKPPLDEKNGGDALPAELLPPTTPPADVPLTLEDCRARTKAVIKKFEDDAYAALGIEREKATREQSDEVMKKTMAFVMGVFQPFGIKKAPELKPEQFAAYMAATAELV